jgi:hypothetical protein
MPQRRGTTTDNLLNIIQVIQLGRKTGILTTERGEGITREDGQLIFVNGQITQANSDRLVGQQALDRLKTWGGCRFIFVPSINDHTVSLQDNLHTQSSRSYTGTFSDTNPSLRTLSPTQGETYRDTQPLTHTTESLLIIHSFSERPQRILQNDTGIRILNRKKLSRTHLRLFLLVDGQRSIAELARLIGKKPDEVQKLLIDLENIGIIQQ